MNEHPDTRYTICESISPNKQTIKNEESTVQITEDSNYFELT